jgi:hypothetical protein
VGVSANADIVRPIFQTAGFEGIDETCSTGTYIGGLAGVEEDAGIASNYKEAADVLVERALADERVHEVLLPVLFLYRHSLELRLKFAVQPQKPNHDLVALTGALDEILVAKRRGALPPGLIERVQEIAAYDVEADAFRFHARKRKKGAQRTEPHFPEEVWVDIAYLRDVMDWVDRELQDAAWAARAPASLDGEDGEPEGAM